MDNTITTTKDPSEEFGPANALDILIPPAVAFLAVLIALFILSLVKQLKWWRWIFRDQTPREAKQDNVVNSSNKKKPRGQNHDELFDQGQKQTIEKFRRYQNNPIDLIKVGIPCLLSIGLCPVAIFLVPMMWDFFYPFDDSRKSNINGTLSPFLLPSSLVYSLAWGFALQDALGKFDTTDANAKHHHAILKQLRELMLRSKVLNPSEKKTVLQKVGLCTTQWMLRQMGTHNECNAIWQILDLYKTSDDHKEQKIMDSLLDKVMELDRLMEEGYRGAAANISLLQWVFQELLGFVAFFGILLINANSYRLELVMCILTVFTISAFALILADLDYAYHGSFCVDLSPFTSFMDELEIDYQDLDVSLKKTEQNVSQRHSSSHMPQSDSHVRHSNGYSIHSDDHVPYPYVKSGPILGINRIGEDKQYGGSAQNLVYTPNRQCLN